MSVASHPRPTLLNQRDNNLLKEGKKTSALVAQRRTVSYSTIKCSLLLVGDGTAWRENCIHVNHSGVGGGKLIPQAFVTYCTKNHYYVNNGRFSKIILCATQLTHAQENLEFSFASFTHAEKTCTQTHPLFALTGVILIVFVQGRGSESVSITNLSSPPVYLFFLPLLHSKTQPPWLL